MSEPGGVEHGPRNPESREQKRPHRWAAISVPREDMRYLRDNARVATTSDTAARMIETKFMAQDAHIPQGREQGLKGGGDAVLYIPELGLYAVFDGVSTQTDTDAGIQIAQEVLVREVRNLPADEQDPDLLQIGLQRAVELAEGALRAEQQARSDAGQPPLGRSTLALALIRNGHIFYIGKGDSPVWLFQPHAPEGKRLERLTTYQDLAERLYGKHPGVVKQIHDLFDSITSKADIPPGLTIPRPPLDILDSALRSAQRANRKQTERAIGEILRTVAVSGSTLSPTDTATVVWELAQARSNIYGGLGSGETKIGVKKIGPDDVVILDSDGLGALTTAEHEELLETQDNPRSLVSASIGKVVEKLAANDWRAKGDDTTREVVKQRTATDALLEYTQHIAALLAKLKPKADVLDPLEELRTIEENQHTRPYEALRAARLLLNQLLFLESAAIFPKPPEPPHPPEPPKDSGVETYREIVKIMAAAGWRGVSSSIIEQPRLLPTDGFTVVACIDNPTTIGEPHLYFFRMANTLGSLPAKLPELPERVVGSLSGHSVHDRVYIDNNGREQHQTESIPLTLETDGWHVDHPSKIFRDHLPQFHEQHWFHVESAALAQWLKFREIGGYEGEFVTVQMVRLEDGQLYYFAKLTEDAPADRVDITNQPENDANTARFAIMREIAPPVAGISNERVKNTLHPVKRGDSGEVLLKQESSQQHYQDVLLPFFRRGWRYAPAELVRTWETGRASPSGFETAYLTVAHVTLPDHKEIYFACNGQTVNPRTPQLPDGAAVQLQFYRRHRRISEKSEFISHLEPARFRENQTSEDTHSSVMEHAGGDPHVQFEFELESMMNDHPYAGWLRSPEALIRSWENTLTTSFRYDFLQRLGIPLDRITIITIENPPDPGHPFFFLSFRATRDDLGIPGNLHTRGTVYRAGRDSTTGLLTLTPEETFVFDPHEAQMTSVPPERVSRVTPAIREREPLSPPAPEGVGTPEVEVSEPEPKQEPPQPPQPEPPIRSWFRSKWGRRISRGLGIAAGILGLRAERGDAGSFESAIGRPVPVQERQYVPQPEDEKRPPVVVTVPDGRVSDATTPDTGTPDAARRGPSDIGVTDSTVPELDKTTTVSPDTGVELPQPQEPTPEPPKQPETNPPAETPPESPETSDIQQHEVTIRPFEPGIQVAVARALREQGIPEGVATHAVNEAARVRHDTKDPLTNKVFTGDKVHFATYAENGRLKIRIGEVERAADSIKKQKASESKSPAQAEKQTTEPKPQIQTKTQAEAQKEWHDGETFHIGSGDQQREFTVGDEVYYTSSKSGLTSEHKVLGPSLDKDPGLILQVKGTKRQFALTRSGAERVIRKADVERDYQEDGITVADEESRAQVDAKGNTLLGKRRVLFTSPDGKPTGKNLSDTLKHIIAKERGIPLDQTSAEALIAIRNADMKGDPNVFLLGQGFVYDLDKEELTIIR